MIYNCHFLSTAIAEKVGSLEYGDKLMEVGYKLSLDSIVHRSVVTD